MRGRLPADVAQLMAFRTNEEIGWLATLKSAYLLYSPGVAWALDLFHCHHTFHMKAMPTFDIPTSLLLWRQWLMMVKYLNGSSPY